MTSRFSSPSNKAIKCIAKLREVIRRIQRDNRSAHINVIPLWENKQFKEEHLYTAEHQPIAAALGMRSRRQEYAVWLPYTLYIIQKTC